MEIKKQFVDNYSTLIIKLLIIGIVLIAGVAVIYPDELIQFSKGTTIQENTEQGLSNLKDSSINEIGNSLTKNIQNLENKIRNTISNIFGSF